MINFNGGDNTPPTRKEKMRRINISKNNKIITKSFNAQNDFVEYLKNHKDSKIFYVYGLRNISNDVWNLKVAEPYNLNGYTFSIQSKRRTGDKIVNNYLIGEQL
jgi:hypothetical protein